jgi:hypothetical protein
LEVLSATVLQGVIRISLLLVPQPTQIQPAFAVGPDTVMLFVLELARMVSLYPLIVPVPTVQSLEAILVDPATHNPVDELASLKSAQSQVLVGFVLLTRIVSAQALNQRSPLL